MIVAPRPAVLIVGADPPLGADLTALGYAVEVADGPRDPRLATAGLIVVSGPPAGAVLPSGAPVLTIVDDATQAPAGATWLARPFDRRLLAAHVELALARHRAVARDLSPTTPAAWLVGDIAPEVKLAITQFAIERAMDAFHLIDHEARFLAVNAASCALLGYDRAELLTMTVHDIDPSFPRAAWPGHWEALVTRRALAVASVVRTRTGELIPVELSVNLLEVAGAAYGFTVMRDARPHQRALAAARDSEARYRALFTGAIESMFRTRVDGRVVDANPAFATLLGYASPDELIGRPIIGHYADPAQRAQLVARVQTDGELRGERIAILKADGSRGLIELHARLQVDEHGEPALQGFARDVTARAQHDAALTALSTGLGPAVDDTWYDELVAKLAAITGADVGFACVREPTGFRSLGLVVDGAVVPEAARASVVAAIRAIADDGPTVIAAGADVLLDPAMPLLIEGVVATPIVGPDGQRLGRLGVMTRRPIADPPALEAIVRMFALRAAAELVRQRAEDRFTAVFEHAPDAILITDERGRIVAANRMAETTLGYPRAALGELAVEDLVPSGLRDTHRHQRQAFASDPRHRAMGRARDGLIAVRKDGREVPVEINLSPIKGADGVHVVAVIRDVTERQKVIRERAQLDSHLRRAQKLEALGTLAGGLAHDFNNLLAAILSNVELAREFPRAPDVDESLTEIAGAATRATELVRQLLAFSRPQTTARAVAALGPVVEDAARMLRAILPAAIALTVELGPGTPMVVVDASQLHGVLLNLGTNAWQAIAGAGTIAVRLDSVELDAGAPGNLRPGRYARITVRDDGAGMDAATLERVFEPFFTTRGIGQGSGLGLAVAHGVVTDHGGAITVESTPGRGTAVTILLPAAPRGAVTTAPPPVPRGRGRLVLVDDDDPVRRATTRQLEVLGYRVVAYADAASALAAIRADPAAVDAIVTDLHMPDVSGIALAAEVAGLRPDLPVVLISGNQEDVAAHPTTGNIRAHLAKPFTRIALAEVIAQVLATRSPSSP